MSESTDISVYSEDVSFTYQDLDQLKWWLTSSIEVEEKSLRILNIIFCSDQYLLELNKEHLNHDYFTDILTFQYNDDPIEGDLFISIDRVQDNATQYEVTFEDELHRVIIHGVLHLCGYNDKNEEEKSIMSAKENQHLLYRITGKEIS